MISQWVLVPAFIPWPIELRVTDCWKIAHSQHPLSLLILTLAMGWSILHTDAIALCPEYIRLIDIVKLNVDSTRKDYTRRPCDEHGKGSLWLLLEPWRGGDMENICNVIPKLVPLCSAYWMPSYQPNFILLAWFFCQSWRIQAFYLNILFFLELACTSCSMPAKE